MIPREGRLSIPCLSRWKTSGPAAQARSTQRPAGGEGGSHSRWRGGAFWVVQVSACRLHRSSPGTAPLASQEVIVHLLSPVFQLLAVEPGADCGVSGPSAAGEQPSRRSRWRKSPRERAGGTLASPAFEVTFSRVPSLGRFKFPRWPTVNFLRIHGKGGRLLKGPRLPVQESAAS